MVPDPRRPIGDEIRRAIRAFATGSLRDRAAELLGVLGYGSERHEAEFDFGPDDFLAWADRASRVQRIAKRPREMIRQTWDRITMVFQYTDDELGAPPDLFGGQHRTWEKSRARSFLFLAVDLKDGDHARNKLAAMTRAINRPMMMPAIVFFRYRRDDGSWALTLAVIHRRAHKRDSTRDVLERATLIKDIRVADPHRAHLDILSELALPSIALDRRTFDALHEMWEDILDTEELNRRFYRSLFEWFEHAVTICSFPDDRAGEGSAERQVIRMITRILFIWFLKEKRLVPEEFFEERFASEQLKDHTPDATDYYCAILQNLFFATLNTPIDKRTFSSQSHATHRDFTKFRYRKLLQDPKGFKKRFDHVPFVNGGLFDCLDTFEHRGGGGRRIDAFTDTDEPDRKVPARVFFDDDLGLFPILRKYKFTVEENTPLDQEVALDPELLGKTFENLLAAYNPETRDHARSSTASYYTPRDVVDYMVREALVEHLSQVVAPYDGDDDWLKDRLRHLFAIDQGEGTFGARRKRGGRPGTEDHLVHAREIGPLIKAIDTLRIIDPACGSGAFPMGILHKLVMALGKIDPLNARWKARQMAVAEQIEDPAVRRNAVRTVELAFSPERGFGDFGRKLYLIQRVIHGVDIQPIATQIAKLRFFISLVIEQPTTDDPNANFGLEPLPNLETCFVAADTLKRLARPEQTEIRSSRVQELKKELRAHRRHWFDAHDRNAKWELKKQDQRIRRSLRDALVEDQWDESTARKIADWNAFDQNACANWFDSEWMFGLPDGFHIVIGNPPYIRLPKNGGRLADRYQNQGYVTFMRSSDTCVLFYERGMELLDTDPGILAYITSNSWLKAQYGKKPRRFFANNHTPLRLLELGKHVFKSAIVDSAVFVVRNAHEPNVAGFPSVDLEHLPDEVTFPDLPAHTWKETRPTGTEPWRILSPQEWPILYKMQDVGQPLEAWDVSIRRGIITGCNDAFFIDDEGRDALIAQDPRSDEIIKPLLVGKDIRRWRPRWRGRWLIYSHSEVAEHDYPAIREHLLPYRKRLLARRGGANPNTGKVPYEWWQLQIDYYRSGAHRRFSKRKLFWMDMSPEGRFSVSETELFCNDKGFVITGTSLDYLCCVLNSNLARWYVQSTALTTGMGVTQWKRFLVEQIPIPPLSPQAQEPFADVTREILKCLDVDRHADISALEADVNRLVYGAYDLPADAIRLLEGGLM